MENNAIAVWPVIHHENLLSSIEQAMVAKEQGAAGVFLISHCGDDAGALHAATKIREQAPADFLVGINLLGAQPNSAIELAVEHGLDAVWADDMGVTSHGAAPMARACRDLASGTRLKLFAGVAFKYQAHEPNPGRAAINAAALGMIPTTSGTATGSAPTPQKIKAMSEAIGGGALAIASGVSAQNIQSFGRFASDVLVASSINDDRGRIDAERLKALMQSITPAEPQAEASTA